MKNPNGQGRGVLRSGRLALLAAVAVAFLASASPAGAVHSTCTEPNGTTWRAEWTRNSSGTHTHAYNLLKRAPGGSSYSSYSDGTGNRWTKLEWFQPDTVNGLFAGNPYASPYVTFYMDEPGYNGWYGHVDGRTSSTGHQVPTLLSPRVAWRNSSTGQNRAADACTAFLADYGGSTGPRTAIVGDSITVQMTKRFGQLANWRPFIEPQSGASFSTMLGEMRGVRAGLRDPALGYQAPPDVIVMALGTNDADHIGAGATAQIREDRLEAFDLTLYRALLDTAGVQCRVLVAPLETGFSSRGNWSDERKWGRQQVGASLREFADGDGSIELVDWHELAKGHYYSLPSGHPQLWYGDSDGVHPNAAGLNVLSNAIHGAATSCG